MTGYVDRRYTIKPKTTFEHLDYTHLIEKLHKLVDAGVIFIDVEVEEIKRA